MHVSELKPGDVLLGWNGEPYDLGMVSSVTKTTVQSYGSAITYVYVISTHNGQEYRAKGSDWRRIAAPPL